MPTRTQLWRLSVGYPWHLDWTPDAELNNRLERLADVAAHEIEAHGSSLAEPAAAAIAELTAALVAVLPQYLAEHAATLWFDLRAPSGGGRRTLVECVRMAARPVRPVGMVPDGRPRGYRRPRNGHIAPRD